MSRAVWTTCLSVSKLQVTCSRQPRTSITLKLAIAGLGEILAGVVQYGVSNDMFGDAAPARRGYNWKVSFLEWGHGPDGREDEGAVR
jgi:hypothetical protein